MNSFFSNFDLRLHIFLRKICLCYDKWLYRTRFSRISNKTFNKEETLEMRGRYLEDFDNRLEVPYLQRAAAAVDSFRIFSQSWNKDAAKQIWRKEKTETAASH